MPLGTSFTLSGANPNKLGGGLSIGQGGDLFSKNNGLGLNLPVNQKSTPFSNALNQAVQSTATPPAIKKQTVTEYHPPTAPAAGSTLTGNNSGMINSAPTPTPTSGVMNNNSQPAPTTQPTSSYAQGLLAAKAAQDRAANFNKNLGTQLNDISSNPNYIAPIAEGRAGLVQRTGTLEGQRLATIATNATTLADKLAPVAQFGVLTDPVTGLPISGDSAGSAAFKGGQIQGQQNAGQNAAGMNVANIASKGIKSTIDQFIQQNPQLNPSDLTFANNIAQWASGQQLGDPKYQTLANYLNEYISTLAPILGVGGDTTNLKTEIAQSFINARASGQSISEVLTNIEKLADDKLKNIVSAGQGGGQVAGGESQNTGGNMFGSFF